MQRLARRLVTFANLNLCVVNVRQNSAEGAPMRVLARGIKLRRDVSVQRPHDADARKTSLDLRVPRPFKPLAALEQPVGDIRARGDLAADRD
jgi:hypothetical protein